MQNRDKDTTFFRYMQNICKFFIKKITFLIKK